MLHTTNASEVVPISLYLWGRSFHGGQFQLNSSASWDLPSAPSSSSEFATWTPLIAPPSTLWLSLSFWFSWTLHKTLALNRSFQRSGLSRREPKAERSSGGLLRREEERKSKRSAPIARLSIFAAIEEACSSGFCLSLCLSGCLVAEKIKDDEVKMCVCLLWRQFTFFFFCGCGFRVRREFYFGEPYICCGSRRRYWLGSTC